MVNALTIEQQHALQKIRELSRVLSDFAHAIENEPKPSLNIQEAIKAIDYYSRNYFRKLT